MIWETTSYVSKYETESNRELDDLRKEFHEISVVDVYLFVELALRNKALYERAPDQCIIQAR